ncbi:MAG: NUDIX hydrolase [Deferribacteres bacterium]|nr:NUDIX hydrolase [Deferribacteres bacterium]
MHNVSQNTDNDILSTGAKDYYPSLSVDNVIFGYHEKELKVLLNKWQIFEKWMLPGGFIKKTETLEQAAMRVVINRTSLKNLYLRQFKIFSNPNRNAEGNFNAESIAKKFGVEVEPDHWMFKNVITVGFFALTEYSRVIPRGDLFSEDVKWWDIKSLPELMLDHNKIVNDALNALKLFIHHHPIGYELLPEKFTLPEIHSLYETILERKIDSRNFSKKLINLGLIIKLDEQKKIGAHRSPFLYIFNKKRYDQIIEDNEIIVI